MEIKNNFADFIRQKRNNSSALEAASPQFTIKQKSNISKDTPIQRQLDAENEQLFEDIEFFKSRQIIPFEEPPLTDEKIEDIKQEFIKPYKQHTTGTILNFLRESLLSIAEKDSTEKEINESYERMEALKTRKKERTQSSYASIIETSKTKIRAIRNLPILLAFSYVPKFDERDKDMPVTTPVSNGMRFDLPSLYQAHFNKVDDVESIKETPPVQRIKPISRYQHKNKYYTNDDETYPNLEPKKSTYRIKNWLLKWLNVIFKIDAKERSPPQ
jgi:hypothetical protein